MLRSKVLKVRAVARKLSNKKYTGVYSKASLLLLGLCIIIAALFTLAPRLVGLTANNTIDPSFNYGVNAAAAAHLAFGTQFIATYGPLSFIINDYIPKYLNALDIWLVLYALVLGVGAWYFLLTYVKSKRWLIAPVLLYVLTIKSLSGDIEWNYLMLFVLYCFIYVRATQRVRIILTIFLAILAAVFSLTKFTLGFGSVASLGLLIIFADNTSWRLRSIIAGAAAFVYLIFFGALGHHFGITSFVSYIKTGELMGSGFSQSMSLYAPETVIATWLVALSLVLLGLWVLLDQKKGSLRYLFIVPPLALIWKYAIVRQDAHIEAIILVTLPMTALIYFTRAHTDRSLHRWLALTIIVLSFAAVWANELPFYGQGGFAQTLTSPVANIVNGQPDAFFRTTQEKQSWAVDSALGLQGAVLPRAMTQLIGRSGVDVFPWEADIVAANNLMWQPRTSPFSFESYEPYFDTANANYYDSAAAPKFIIWHSTGINSIDFRYILWDEPATFRSMLSHYQLVSSNQNFMLLERRQVPVHISYDTINLGPLLTGSQIALHFTNNKELGLVYFSLRQGVLGKLKVQLLREDQYYVSVSYADGSSRMFRLVTPNTSQGLLMNGMPTDWNSLIGLLNTDNNAQSKAEAATSIQLSRAP
jgi:hypothetical protein